MRKLILFSCSFFIGLIVLVLLGWFALCYWIDPNTLIAPLSQKIQQKTGLVMHINGPLTWHVFPTASIDANDIRLQAPTDPSATQIHIQSLNTDLALWPLITKKQLIIHSVRVDGVDAILAPHTPKVLKQTAVTTELSHANAISTNKTSSQKISFAVNSIQITQATLHGLMQKSYPDMTIYLDQFSIQNINSVATTTPIPLQLAMRIENGGHSLAIAAQSNVLLNLDNQTLQLKDLNAKVNTMQINGTLQCNQFLNSPTITGQLALNDQQATDTVRLLTQKNIGFINTLQANFTLSADKQKIDLSPFTATINQDTLNGNLQYDLSTHHLTSTIQADTLHWPKLSLTTPSPNLPVPATTSKTLAADPSTTSSTGNKAKDSFSLDSTMNIKHFLYQNLSLDTVQGKIHYDSQKLILDPIAMTVFQGNYQGKVKWVSSAVDNLTIAGSISHLNLALLQQYLGKKTSITGLLDANGSLSSYGQSLQQRMASLNGTLAMAINHGSWTRLNMSNILSFLNALNPSVSAQSSNEFSSLSGHFNIKNGQANNSDLLLISPLLKAKGNGRLDLAARTLHYSIIVYPNAELLKPISDLSKIVIVQGIPVTIKGPWEKPKVKVEQGDLLKGQLEQPVKGTFKQLKNLIIIH